MLTVSQLPHDRTKIYLSWSANTKRSFSHYKIVVNDSEIIDNIMDTGYLYTLSASGTYTFKMYAVNKAGFSSKHPATTAKSILIEAGTVANFIATQNPINKKQIILSWTPNTDYDFDHYVIKLGKVWGGTTALEPSYKGSNSYVYTLPSTGVYSFMIKAVTVAGKESVNESKVVDVSYSVTPNNVIGGDVVFRSDDRTIGDFSWITPVGESDIKYYIVKCGNSTSTWSNATQVFTTVNNTYSFSNTTSGTYKFFVAPVSNAGLEGTTPFVVTKTLVLEPNVPTALSVVKSSFSSTEFVFSWTAPINTTDIDKYEVKYGGTNSDWNSATNVSQNIYDTNIGITISSSGDYKFFVKTVNKAGYESVVAISANTLSVEASTPTGFTLVQRPSNKSIADLSWSAITDPDIDFYEVRLGSVWATATPVTSQIGLTFAYNIPSAGSYNFLLKAVNKSGKYSVTPTVFNTTLGMTPNAPTALVFAQNNSLDRSAITLTWTPPAVMPTDFDSYAICYGAWNEDVAYHTTTNSYTHSISPTDPTNFIVRTRSKSGYYSTDLVGTCVLKIAPDDVTGLVISQRSEDKSKLVLAWNPLAEGDISYYVIKIGVGAWASATLICSGINSTTYSYQLPDELSKTFQIKAVNKAGFESVNALTITGTYTFTPLSAPTLGYIRQNTVDRTVVELDWNDIADTDLFCYEIVVGSTWIDANKIIRTDSAYSITIADESNVTILVRARNVAGKVSPLLTATLTGITIIPQNVSGLSVVQSPLKRDELNFAWTSVTTTDFSYYEIRKGLWSDNVVIATNIKTNYINGVVVANEGSATYIIKAFTKVGKESVTANSTSLTISYTPPTMTTPTSPIIQSTSDSRNLSINWNSINTAVVTDFDHYELVVGSVWAEGSKIVLTNNSYNYRIVADSSGAVRYTFLVKSVTKAGKYSPILTIFADISLNPPDVTGLTFMRATGGDKRVFKVNWSTPSDKDISYFRVKSGLNTDTWASATMEVESSADAWADIFIDYVGIKRVFLKAVNKNGKESVGSVYVDIDTSLTANTLNPDTPLNVLANWTIQNRNKIIVTWDKNSSLDIAGYEVKLSTQTWSQATTTLDNTSALAISSSGMYVVNLRVKNLAGFYSSTVTVSSPTATLEPSPVVVDSIKFTQNSNDRKNFLIEWGAISDYDFDHYNLSLENVTKATGVQSLALNVKNPYYSYNLITEDVYKFYVTAVNILGKSSASVNASVTPSLTPTAPTNFLYSLDNTKAGRVILTWNKIADLDFDSFEIKQSTDTWGTASVQSLLGTTATFVIATTGSVTFNLRAKNYSSFYSTAVNLSVPIKVEPADVTNFVATQSTTDKRGINFNWNGVADLDVDYYTIKQGTVWSSATLVASRITSSSYTGFSVSTAGTYNFLIKATNKQGKDSLNAVAITPIIIGLTPSTPTLPTTPFQTSARDKSIIMLTWNAILDPDLLLYQVKCNGTVIAETKDNFYSYNIYTVGSYVYSVCAKNLSGNVSSDLQLFSGNIALAPSDVSSTGFVLNQSDLDCRELNFAWTKIDDSDLSYYELRIGSSWASATVLATNVRSNYYQINVTPANYSTFEGSKTYLVKAFNAIGFPSVTAGSCVKAISFTPTSLTVGSVVSSITNRFLLTISWTKQVSLDLDYYEVTYTTPAGVSSVVYRGKENSFIYDVTSYGGGLHTFNIRIKNLAGFYLSNPLTLTGNISAFPTDIANFVVTQSSLDRRIINFAWDKNNDTDFNYYEIRKGGTWGAYTQIVATNLQTNSFSYSVSASETGVNYWIKAFNTGGKEGQTPTNKTIDISLKPSTPISGSASHDVNDKGNVIIKWNPITDTDIMNYELKLANQDLVPDTDLSTLKAFPSATSAVLQVDGFWKLSKGTDTEMYMSNHYTVTAGDTITESFYFKCDGTSIGFNINFYGATFAQYVPATIIDMGNGIKLAYASFTIPVGATWVLAIALHDFTGNWTWISFSNPKLEKIISVKESFYTYRPNDLSTLGYDFIVQSKNIGGQYSDPLWIPFSANFCPSDVTGIVASQSLTDHTQIKVQWNAVADKDIAYYIVKRGTDWNNPQATYTVITQSFVVDTISTQSTFYWMVKAVNKVGKESANVSSSVGYSFNMIPPVPSNVVAVQNPANRSQVTISWQEQSDINAHQQDLKEYEVRYGLTWAGSTLIVKTQETSIIWNPNSTQLGVTLFVKSSNNAGYQSAEASSIPYNIILEPSSVTNFNALQNGESILFTWDKSLDVDVMGYEIREGSAFDFGNVIATGITLTQYSLPVDMEITRMFHIKAINTGGKYSSNPLSLTITIRNLAPKNVIQTFNEIPEAYVTFDGTTNYMSSVTLASSTVYTVEYWTQFLGTQNGTMTCGFGIASTVTGVDLYTTGNIFGFNEWVQAPYGINILPMMGDGKWHFVVAQFTLAFATNKIWIDGTPQTLTGISTKTFTSLPTTFNLGRGASNDTTYKHIGKLKKVRVYNRQLLDSEVLDHYKGKYTDIDNTLLSYWKFDDLSGATIADKQGLNTGTMVGTPVWGLDIPGTLTNATFGRSTINCSNVGTALGRYKCSDFIDGVGSPTTKCNQIGGNIVLQLAKVPNLYAGDSESGLMSSDCTGFAYSWSTDYAHTGTKSLKITFPNNINRDIYPNSTITVASSLSYTFSCNIRKLDGSIPTGILGWATGGVTGQIGVTTKILAGDNGWYNLSYTVTYPSIQAVTQYGLSNFEATTYYLDDWRMEVGSVANAYYSAGTYQTVVKDMLSKVTANVGTVFSATSAMAIGVNSVLQYRTSLDNVIWETWRNFIPVLATFRYIQFQVVLNTTDTSKSPEVPLFSEIIDVPDTDKHGTSIVPSAGLTIYYDPYYLGQVYYTTPTVVATALQVTGDVVGKYAVVKQSDIYLDRFIVKVYNSSDTNMTTPVTGTVNWIAKGY